MKAWEFHDALNKAMREKGYGSRDIEVMLDGSVLPIKGVKWHEGYDCFVVEVDLT